jgi:hypothetical protein
MESALFAFVLRWLITCESFILHPRRSTDYLNLGNLVSNTGNQDFVLPLAPSVNFKFADPLISIQGQISS